MKDVWLLYQDAAIVEWVASPWSVGQAEAFAVDWRRKCERHSVGKWMAYLHDGSLVGRGGLSRMDAGGRSTMQIQRLVDPSWQADRLEIGWALRSEFHGGGGTGAYPDDPIQAKESTVTPAPGRPASTRVTTAPARAA